MPAYFKFVRTEAEREAYRKHVHPSLDQIYAVLAGLPGIHPKALQKLKNEELRLEVEWSRPNPTVLSAIAESRKRHGHVLFLSDMYLPREFIVENLRKKGVFLNGDRLYVSNQEGSGKSDGGLYHDVLEREQLSPESLCHHGNCPHADVRVPEGLGIATRLYFNGNLTAWEEQLELFSDSTDGLGSLWSGASRRARCTLDIQTGSLHQATVLESATSVAGPLLTTFVHWSLQRAAADGVRTLVFVARDGQILYEIAKKLKVAEPTFEHLDLRYIYGSRQAWRSASILSLGEFERSWVLEGSHELTREKLIARVGLDRSYAQRLPDSMDADILWDALKTEVGEEILDSAGVRRGQALKYLEQEQLLENRFLGFVEIGCTGTTLAALERMLAHQGSPPPKTYFFGLANGGQSQGPAQPSTYFYNEQEGMGLQASSDFNYFVLLEMFCAATHGRTSGYREVREGVEPVLEPTQRYWEEPGGTELLQAGIAAFAEAYADSPLIEMDPATAVPLMSLVMRKFWQEPTKEVAETWGSYRKEHDQSGFGAPEMARVHTLKDLPGCVRRQGLPSTWWPAATEVRTSKTTLKLLKTGTRAGRKLAKARIGLGRFKNRLLGKR